MRAYADSSFMVKLISREAGSDAAQAEYRRKNHPPLFFIPLHAIEVENAILHRAFFERQSLPARQRAAINREKNAALARLNWMKERGSFVENTADWDEAVEHARALAAQHAERLGVRTIDLLHVAFALDLGAECFFTTDGRQADLAKAVGLAVISIADDD